MQLKNAVAVCLISLFSATLVVLIVRALDLTAASRLEPQLKRIADDLDAIRNSGGVPAGGGQTAEDPALDDGLIVYYFHGNERCATCKAIESQAHEVVQSDFAPELGRGEIAWKVLNYEEPASSALTKKFAIQMADVVLARMKGGQIERWKRLDEVWALVGDKPAFAKFVQEEIREMLHPADQPPAAATPRTGPQIPVPSTNPADIPVPTPPDRGPTRS